MNGGSQMSISLVGCDRTGNTWRLERACVEGGWYKRRGCVSGELLIRSSFFVLPFFLLVLYRLGCAYPFFSTNFLPIPALLTVLFHRLISRWLGPSLRP